MLHRVDVIRVESVYFSQDFAMRVEEMQGARCWLGPIGVTSSKRLSGVFSCKLCERRDAQNPPCSNNVTRKEDVVDAAHAFGARGGAI